MYREATSGKNGFKGHNWQSELAFAFPVRLMVKFCNIVKGPVARKNPENAQLFILEKMHSSPNIKCIMKPVDLPEEKLAFQGACRLVFERLF
jgi:hypothetical protein